jgi:exosortase/archaeosortase family protein
MRAGQILRDPSLPPLALALAFWPVWRWYAMRITAPWEEPWGLVALLAAVIFLLWRRPPEHTARPALLPAGALLLLYLITYPILPPLARASIAVTALGVTLASWRLGRVFHMGIWGLLLLSLPIVPALQFFLGYPLRTITALIASALLRMNGFAVRPEGTCLDWNGELVWVDAPCSGIKMLWTGMFLTMALSCFRGLGTMRTLVAASLTLVATILANGVRTAALFYIEAGVVDAPGWAHEWTGLAVFIATAFLILWYTIRLRGADSCEPSLSF